MSGPRAGRIGMPVAERIGYVGWVEFVRDGGSTTHIAYFYEDGSIYFPEGPQVASEWELRAAEAAGRMWPLVRGEWEDKPELVAWSKVDDVRSKHG